MYRCVFFASGVCGTYLASAGEMADGGLHKAHGSAGSAL
jgi:hypothetical protein